jgi:para-nitrobenzyl esterase
VLFASDGAMAHGHHHGDHRPIVTESGPLKGITVNGVNEYLGIPYAAAPVGSLRWTPPQAFGTWPGVLQATQFGNECPQAPSPFGKASNNEDCLFLNVYTPSGDEDEGEGGAHARDHGDKPRGGRAVMVWIHGGGLIVGGRDLFDPTPLVRRGVIIVTINYRLGLFGFLLSLRSTGKVIWRATTG